MLEKLRASNNQLEMLADRLDVLFACPERPDLAMLAVMRWDIANLAMRHMSMVDRFVLAHLASDTRADVREIVRRFRQDSIDWLGSHTDHAKQWPAERVERDWDGFRWSAAGQVTVLRSVLDATRETIFPLACPVKSTEPMRLSRNWASEGLAVKESVALLRVPGPEATDARTAGRC